MSPNRIPAVDYLVLDDREPHLQAHECTDCGALYFDRRNACARCSRTDFSMRALATSGTVRAFTIVYRAAKSVATPYTSVVVDLDGGGVVKANLVGVTDPLEITAGMQVRLQTFSIAQDDEGTEAVAFAFVPEVQA